MTMTISGSSGLIFPDGSGQETGIGRNRIINGAMVIDQRNAGASVTANDDVFILDRWITVATASSKMTGQQNAGSVTPPAGFTNYLGITSSSAYSVGASDIFAIRQKIEGYNVSDLDFGKSTAKTITFSFWVRSSLTGTFGGALMNSAGNRCYPFTYTISAANTWEQKTVTVAGDTSGTWLTTNGVGLSLVFNLGTGTTYSGTAGAWSSSLFYSATGATSVVGTNGATFYITGVQLEIGTSATPFERRLYGQELINCQRYYQLAGNGATGRNYSATSSEIVGMYKVNMRASPTATFGGFSGSQALLNQFSIGNVTMSSLLGYSANTTASYYNPQISGGTTGTFVAIIAGDAFALNAEL